MTIDLTRWVDFLAKAKITPNQYAFMAIMYEKKFSLIYQLKESTDVILGMEELEDLIDRDFIHNWNQHGLYQLDQFELTEKAKTMFELKCEWACAEAFIKAYPKWLYINGKQVPAQSCDLDELERQYYKKVVKRGMHEEVMDQLAWAVKNHKISMGIEKWFQSRQWQALAEMRDTTSNVILPADRELR
jgi:hypothetical protein